ncbi:proteasomal ATPase-associated factor 1-like [Crassostrea angulata]|uniref:proteasomal ATPase-associated factor 1-like n=1 Tax=Magallana angulata TaxID=2784310 RepID=UPI0022B182F1|nr:proteasomal ATPase-associated factor 1-like [Crassostrea angulata]
MERLILQSDWDEVLKEKEEKTWVSYKQGVQRSIHGSLRNQGVSTSGVPYVTGSDGFTVQEVTKRSITVSYTDDSVNLSRKFVAPSTSFKSIHSERKSVVSLDVTGGGLGVSADSEGKLRLWQTDTGEVRRELVGHCADVYTCRFFPSGIVVLSGGADMQLKIWSAETGKCAATLIGHRGAINDTAIVDRGRNVVSCGRDGAARLWDVGQQQCLGTFQEIGGEVNSCCLGDVSATLSLEAGDQPTSDREVGTEGKLLVLGCENSTVQGYGLQIRKKVFEFPTHGPVNTCAFLSEVTAVCGTQDGHITVLDLRNIRVPLQEWKDSRSAILCFCPYKGGFFTGTGDGSCFYVDSQFHARVELTGSDCDPVYAVKCDGSDVYTACRDSHIRKYSLAVCGDSLV